MFMNANLVDRLRLYAVSDRRWLAENGYTIYSAVEETIKGGATMIQLREKELNYEDFLHEAIEVKKITKKYGVPLIVNDNVDVAVASDADGLHLGQEDLIGKDIRAIRKSFGKNKIIGISANTLEEALAAERLGADYLGIDTPFSTGTKLDAKNASFENMEKIAKSVKIPCVAIGGIKIDNISLLKNTGIVGVAVVSAIFAEKNIFQKTQELADIVNKNFV